MNFAKSQIGAINTPLMSTRLQPPFEHSNSSPLHVKRARALKASSMDAYQKCIDAIHMLPYGLRVDACNEYCRLDKFIVSKCMKSFVAAIWSYFEFVYLRQPTQEDFEQYIEINKARGFFGMFGTIDCMH